MPRHLVLGVVLLEVLREEGHVFSGFSRQLQKYSGLKGMESRLKRGQNKYGSSTLSQVSGPFHDILRFNYTILHYTAIFSFILSVVAVFTTYGLM